MAKRNAFDNIDTQPAAKVTGRPAAEKTISKMYRVTPQQEQRHREAVFLSGESMQSIVLEGVELWIEKNLKGKM